MKRNVMSARTQYEFVGEVKAEAGYYFLELLCDSGIPSSLIFQPVIAWALESGNYFPYPITLEGVQTENIAILRPDGGVSIPCEGSYLPSLEDWLADNHAMHTLTHDVRKA